MQKKLNIKVLPSEMADPLSLISSIAASCSLPVSEITGFHILKKSLDARRKQIWFNLTLNVFIAEPFYPSSPAQVQFKDVHQSSVKVIITGAGPCGLFAALRLIEMGIKPVILERGKDVRARRRDLANINKEGIINPESNYCFGEGGAGTYSDGKLYTRSSKRGNISQVLNYFVIFGADEKILYESHPHIGTNKLPQIITAMREQIIACGGEVLFNKKVVDFKLEKNKIKEIITSDGDSYSGDAFILATGHSARDIFQLFRKLEILIEPKAFALGVRVEHPQALIDSIQYHADFREVTLPPASYSLVYQSDGKGVFSFCMCPGGIIAPAVTDRNEIVVNGWSPSKRNNPFANSGIVVSVGENNLTDFSRYGDLAGMYFQQSVEQESYAWGGGNLVAPAQRLSDFIDNKISSTLPVNSYLPGLQSCPLKEILPDFISSNLQSAFKVFGKKMKGYLTNEAVVVATESRTSSPVRIPRNADTLTHPQIHNLFPCGEGAGYAGGIVSAAMDGQRAADIIASLILKK